MFTTLTITGDRPVQFETVIRCMNKQTIKPDLWLITDDGKTPVDKSLLDTISCEYKYVRLEPIEEHSLKRNFLEALNYIPKDFSTVIIEDDDYYPKPYLNIITAGLQYYSLFGVTINRIYQLWHKSYTEMNHRIISCLYTTAFRYDILDKIRNAAALNARESYSVDCRIWIDGGIEDKATVDLKPGNTPIGLKGWPVKGRPGTTASHRGRGICKHKDTNLLVFNNWLGEDAEYYKKFLM